jgi:hypothetical protein
MDVCLRLFCVCVVLCVGRGLATGWLLVQGVLPAVYRIQISELINSEWGRAAKREEGNGINSTENDPQNLSCFTVTLKWNDCFFQFIKKRVCKDKVLQDSPHHNFYKVLSRKMYAVSLALIYITHSAAAPCKKFRPAMTDQFPTETKYLSSWWYPSRDCLEYA